ncbi:MFS transporter [Nonomuraea sp. SYSU D8015]|uniref:MFS transporter n=1 Tax=Nonomuraea sp. SYSU D8015 TaxID=2593644 RepID=UPI001CB6BFCF|nr:MFS transporter [Nonomuraea sp. SYSU D8015]
MTGTHQVTTHRVPEGGRGHAQVVKAARHRAGNGAGLVQLVAYGGAVLVMLDSSATPAVLVALRSDGIAEAVAQPELTSVSTLNLMAAVGLLAGVGGVSRALGHRRMLWAGLVLFGLGGMISAVAPAWAVLLAGRLAQGVATALLLPALLMLVMQDLPIRRRSRALAYWVCWCGLGSVLALSGASPIVSSHGWRVVYLAAAVGAFALLTALTSLLPARQPSTARADVAVNLLTLGSLVAAGVVASEGSRWGWTSLRTVVCGVMALGLAGAGLALRTRTAHGSAASQERWHPGWGGLSSCLHGAIWLIMLGLGAPLAPPAGLDVIQWGGWLLPVWLGLAVATPIAAAWGRRYGARAVLYGSCIAAMVGCLLLAAQPSLPGWGALAAALVGAGLGALLTATCSAGLHPDPPSQQASAAGALAGARTLAGMMGTSTAAALVDHPLPGERLPGHTGVMIGAVGLASLLATALLVHALPALHAAHGPAAAPRAALIVHPLTAEAEAAALRQLLTEVRHDIASMHDDVSVALARLQATAQEPVELDEPPPSPTHLAPG